MNNLSRSSSLNPNALPFTPTQRTKSSSHETKKTNNSIENNKENYYASIYQKIKSWADHVDEEEQLMKNNEYEKKNLPIFPESLY